MGDVHVDSELLRREELYLSTPYVGPSGRAESLVAEIWLKVLGLDTVGTLDDFFEIGGDSLAATVLASELEEAFKGKFSPSSIIENSTVSAQAAFFAKQKESPGESRKLPSCMTMFNAQGKKPPLFLVHGRRGFTLYHKSFLDGIDSDQPVAFLEAPGLDGRETPPDRIEQYAEFYLDALREAAPEGNWQLAANCSGSLIAYEMCLLAEQRGDRVVRLMLVDPLNGRRAAKALWRRKKWRKQIGQDIKSRLSALLSGRVNNRDDVATHYDAAVDDFAKRHEKYDAKIRNRTENVEGSIVPSRVAYDPQAMQKVCYQLDKAFFAYVLKQEWHGQSFILTSQGRSDGLDSWRQYLPNVYCRVVDFKHSDIFNEGLGEVVTFLVDAMSQDYEERFSK